MTIDHASVIFIGTSPTIWRLIGRIAFSIFAFLIAQGVKHSKSNFKYALRLLLFAFISEIPYDFAFYGSIFTTEKQNVYFTLFLGLLSIIILEKLQKINLDILAVFSTVFFASAAMILRTDHGFMGVVVITLMYVFSQVKTSARYAGFALSSLLTCFAVTSSLNFAFIPQQAYATLSVIPIAFYNGKRGKKINKYTFYVFYPLHILVLVLIKKFIIG